MIDANVLMPVGITKVLDKKDYSKSGIYQILNTVNGKLYIGSAYKFNLRFNKHNHKLSSNKHSTKHMQLAFNKYGGSSFVFSILAIVERNNNESDNDFNIRLTAIENDFILKNKANNKEFGYNKRIDAKSNRGVSHSVDAKTRIKGKKLSDITKQKMSEATKGEKHHAVKLTNEDVIKIKVLLHLGNRNINIAEFMGIKKSMINDIKNNGNWSHIELTESDIEKYRLLSIGNNSRVNDLDIFKIKYMISLGYENYVIAKYLNTKKIIPAQIKRGFTYKQELPNGFSIDIDLDKITAIRKGFKDNAISVQKERFKTNLATTAILNNESVKIIWQRIQSKEPLTKISKDFGVCYDTIYKIKVGVNWSNVTSKL